MAREGHRHSPADGGNERSAGRGRRRDRRSAGAPCRGTQARRGLCLDRGAGDVRGRGLSGEREHDRPPALSQDSLRTRMLANYRDVFALRDFRRFWIGASLSMFGDAMTRTAFTWFVYEQTKSPGAIGILMICYTGPVLVGGLAAGWALDRFDRRTVMIADCLVRGAAIALVPILHWLGLLQLWHVYAAAGVYGLLMMVSLAGIPTLIPSLVDESRLRTANALEILSYTLSGIVGPALAGLLI